MYGSGFPKSYNIAKGIDQAGGASPSEQARLLTQRRELQGLSRLEVAKAVGCTESSVRDWEEGRARTRGGVVEYIIPSLLYRKQLADLLGYSKDERKFIGVATDRRGDGTVMGLGLSGDLTVGGQSEMAKLWQGYGTALKPAYEPIIIAMKPLDGTFAENALKHGVAGINIDGTRIGYEAGGNLASNPSLRTHINGGNGGHVIAHEENRRVVIPNQTGRWPANVILSHTPDCRQVGTVKLKPKEGHRPNPVAQQSDGNIQFNQKPVGYQKISYTGPDGTEKVGAWECSEDCPVRLLDEQSGVSTSTGGQASLGAFRNGDIYGKGRNEKEKRNPGLGDTGGASRFFYCAKASRRERGEGNNHPCCKPLKLCEYLAKLIKPPAGGKLLVPFSGSGSEMIGALAAGWKTVHGIEQSQEYVEIARRRIKDWREKHKSLV
jgi:site-specific DNA-methyltransferase (adenine-specific)